MQRLVRLPAQVGAAPVLDLDHEHTAGAVAVDGSGKRLAKQVACLVSPRSPLEALLWEEKSLTLRPRREFQPGADRQD